MEFEHVSAVADPQVRVRPVCRGNVEVANTRQQSVGMAEQIVGYVLLTLTSVCFTKLLCSQ